ncbi:MAG: GTP cyclohydrolase I FolE [Sedimentisphaerales bacterium]|nr:GTP cyclohydrolase I FolE [Sedimentisphaerales bacterium]
MKPKPEPNGIDLDRIEKAVREILYAIGEDPGREGIKDTPARIARMYAELFNGPNEDPRRHLEKVFTENYDEIVLLKDIPFHSMCEHHLLPFIGQAHVGYIPRGKVIGVSKLARIVSSFARRPQVQERLTTQIAEFLIREIDAQGVAVVMEASHTCMTIRGVKKPGSIMVTSAMLGRFRSDARSRAEIMSLIRDR